MLVTVVAIAMPPMLGAYSLASIAILIFSLIRCAPFQNVLGCGDVYVVLRVQASYVSGGVINRNHNHRVAITTTTAFIAADKDEKYNINHHWQSYYHVRIFSAFSP
jgi:hypothetical protein